MKRYSIPFLLIFGFFACSKPDQVLLEFRIAEDNPAPGLSEMIYTPTGKNYYLHSEILLTQADVDHAFVIRQEGRPAIELVLKSEGTKKFGELTENNIGKRCGIVMNGQLVSAPRIMAPIHVGQAIIVGHFTNTEARQIAQGLSGQ